MFEGIYHILCSFSDGLCFCSKMCDIIVTVVTIQVKLQVMDQCLLIIIAPAFVLRVNLKIFCALDRS